MVSAVSVVFPVAFVSFVTFLGGRHGLRGDLPCMVEFSVASVAFPGGLRSLGCISRDLKDLRDRSGDHPEPA